MELGGAGESCKLDLDSSVVGSMAGISGVCVVSELWSVEWVGERYWVAGG